MFPGKNLIIYEGMTSMEIVERLKFSKEESCEKLGLKHPVYILLDKAKDLEPGKAIEIATDDHDWAITIRTVMSNAGYKVLEEREGEYIKQIIYR